MKRKVENEYQTNFIKNLDIKKKKCCDAIKLKLLEISPNGKIIISVIGHSVFIKILNLSSLEDQYNINNSKVENHNTAFLPIYFDFDYGNEYSEL